jgi:hypothetical protein
MTISHPSKVKIDILSSGIDSLVLSLYVDWKETAIFSYLDECKEQAKKFAIDYQGQLKHFNPGDVWPFTIKPHGSKGFSWLLIGADFTYKIANSQEPSSRPNVMIEIRSETLWRLGPEEALNIALGLIVANGGDRIEAKPSRGDLCVDFLMPEKLWSDKLMKYAVTRAADIAPYFHHKKLTGIRIGKGVITARLYDKPLEIKQQSKKEWMFDIWGLKEIPEGKKIIRIEFQLRREVLRDLKIKDTSDLFQKIDGAWAYCTKEWLKFQDRPGLHHTQRSTFVWYEQIQNGFKGVQGAEPLVREKAVRADKRRLMQQASGMIVSLHAIALEEQGAKRDTQVKIDDCVISYVKEIVEHRKDLPDIQEKLARKRSKYHREKPKAEPGQTIYTINRDTIFRESIKDDQES